ncbi:uncharacterized protein ASCRUDRAFT_73284 [Ascoidea rubescens DSM 1968]|uniref:Uncharacterized protein n=1 Tax=Ascoidea rubescens DSM 1968 TaxID=1344418 RepID=A0A1D2VP91_9ASCO|nr:hypothetical protein ASCRUDRAFT_73284 [Ascoidea rubescens DSM 1968]ODV63419.1 hypothetical protein ASCRUDRAFT_73284 [Ascoidea rubescens DSM 1968]
MDDLERLDEFENPNHIDPLDRNGAKDTESTESTKTKENTGKIDRIDSLDKRNPFKNDTDLKQHNHKIFLIDKTQEKKLESRFSKENVLLVYISVFDRIEPVAQRLKPLLPAISFLMAASFLIQLEE